MYRVGVHMLAMVSISLMGCHGQGAYLRKLTFQAMSESAGTTKTTKPREIVEAPEPVHVSSPDLTPTPNNPPPVTENRAIPGANDSMQLTPPSELPPPPPKLVGIENDNLDPPKPIPVVPKNPKETRDGTIVRVEAVLDDSEPPTVIIPKDPTAREPKPPKKPKKKPSISKRQPLDLPVVTQAPGNTIPVSETKRTDPPTEKPTREWGIERMEFCSKIDGFGKITRVKPEFQRGQKVLLYVELVQPQMVQEQDEWVTRIQGDIQLIPTEPKETSEPITLTFDPVVDRSKTRRGEFFCHFMFEIPDRLSEGNYQATIALKCSEQGPVAKASTVLRIRVPGTKE